MPLICLHGLLTLSPILTVLFYHFRMYRTLTNSKLIRRLSNRSIVLNNIFGYLHSSFLNIAFQKNSPEILIFTLYAAKFLDMSQQKYFRLYSAYFLQEYWTHNKTCAILINECEKMLSICLNKQTTRICSHANPAFQRKFYLIKLAEKALHPQKSILIWRTVL